MIFTAVIALAFYQTVIAIARTEAQVRCYPPWPPGGHVGSSQPRIKCSRVMPSVLCCWTLP